MFERFKRLNKFSLAGQIHSDKIVEAIRMAEEQTSAEIRVHYTTCLSNDTILDEAKKTFEKLKMHNTAHRNAVLIFLRLRTKEIAILGDIGIHQHVGNEFWNAVKEEVIQTIQNHNVTDGIVKGVEITGKQLGLFFPALDDNPNELSNEVTSN